MNEGLAAPGTEAPAVLPDALVLAALAARPVLAQGDPPGAVVILVEIEAKGQE